MVSTSNDDRITYPRHLMLFLAFTVTCSSFAQKGSRFFVLDINRSVHGSGDLPGILTDVRYVNTKGKKTAWYGELGGTVNNGRDYFFYKDDSGNPKSTSIRYVTAGIQLGAGFRYSPLKSSNEISIQAGPIVRYQSSSLPFLVSTYYPPFVNTTFPVHSFDQGEDKMETIALGAKLRIAYSYTFKKGFLAGINGNYQTDTNADAIYSYGITVGKAF